VLYVLDELGAGRFGYALLLVMLALGAILGSWIAGPLRRRFGVSNAITVSVAGMFVGIVTPGVSATMAAATPALIVGGAGAGIWNIVTVSLRQRIVPEELLGRVTSAYRVVAYGAMPVGAAIGGFVGHAFGLRAPWIVAGVLLALASAVALPTLRSERAEAEAPAAG
jgi:MFS family permease